jgi:hypothetical protein
MKTTVSLTNLDQSEIVIFLKWVKRHSQEINTKIADLIIKAKRGELPTHRLHVRIARIAKTTRIKAAELVKELESQLQQVLAKWYGDRTPKQPRYRVVGRFQRQMFVQVCHADASFA